MKIGLEELPEYFTTKNPFLTGVREYRSRDFAGLFCSNSFTYFEAASYKAEECSEELIKVMAKNEQQQRNQKSTTSTIQYCEPLGDQEKKKATGVIFDSDL